MNLRRFPLTLIYICILSAISPLMATHIVPIITNDHRVIAQMNIYDREETARLLGSIHADDVKNYFGASQGAVVDFSVLHEAYLPCKITVKNESNNPIYLKKNAYGSFLSHTAKNRKELHGILQKITSPLQLSSGLSIAMFTILNIVGIGFCCIRPDLCGLTSPASHGHIDAAADQFNHKKHTSDSSMLIRRGGFVLTCIADIALLALLIQSSSLAAKLSKKIHLISNKGTTVLGDPATKRIESVTSPHLFEILPGQVFSQTIFIKLDEHTNRNDFLANNEFTLCYGTMVTHAR